MYNSLAPVQNDAFPVPSLTNIVEFELRMVGFQSLSAHFRQNRCRNLSLP